MKKHFLTLAVAIGTTGSLIADTEVERLRSLVKEQEAQIRQLEIKISRLSEASPENPFSLLPPKQTDEVDLVLEDAAVNKIYTVKRGDSLERIARRNGMKQQTLCKYNGLRKNAIIFPGQKLQIPRKSEMIGRDEEQQQMAEKKSTSYANKTHKIQRGETFYRLAQKYGVSVKQLVKANPNVNYRALRMGQKIQIPEQAAQQPSVSNSAQATRKTPRRQAQALDKPVKVNDQITYQQFARNYHTTTKRLDELNGLSLDPDTLLAEGSELYIPARY